MALGPIRLGTSAEPVERAAVRLHQLYADGFFRQSPARSNKLLCFAQHDIDT